MSRFGDQAPVGYTCGTIDGIIDYIKEVEGCEECGGVHHQALKDLEKVRSDNAELRDWGNELYDDKEELQSQVDDLEKEKSQLEEELASCKEYIAEIEQELNSFRSEQFCA